MAEFQMMNIFFVIASIGCVIFVVLIGAAMFYIVKLIRTIERIAETVEDEARELKADIDAARENSKQKGLGLLSLLFGFAGRTGTRMLKKKRKKN